MVKNGILIAIAVLLTAGLIYLGGLAWGGDKTNSHASIPSTSSQSATPPTKTSVTSFNPITITGSGSKTTAPFTVTTDEWIMDWSYSAEEPEYAIISFFVYPRGETEFFVESVLFPEQTSGTTYSYAGPGEYYIEVAAANIEEWEIVIRPAP